MVLGFALVSGFFNGSINGSYLITWWSRHKTSRKILRNIFEDKWVCFSCGVKLKGMDMIPIYSYLRHMGKCRYCGCSIGGSILIWELGGGLLGALIYYLVLKELIL